MAPKAAKAKAHRLSDVEKIIIVRLITERKDILFGNFSTSDGITHDRKRKAWNEIIEECKEKYGFDAVAEDKDYNHLRNHVWGDLKKRVLEKRDRLARTGSQGEEMTLLEKQVLEAVGSDSALVEGLPVAEQWEDRVRFARTPAESNIVSETPSSSRSLPAASLIRSSLAGSGRLSASIFHDEPTGDDGRELDSESEHDGDRTSTSAGPRVPKRPHALSEDEDKKQSELKTEILYLQKKNLLLENQKLELEIESLRRSLN